MTEALAPGTGPPPSQEVTYDGPVVWVLPYLQRGGTEHHVLYLLQSVRWRIPPVLLAPPGPLAAEFTQAGAVVRHFHDPTRNAWRGLASYLKALDATLRAAGAAHPCGAVPRPIVHVHGGAELAWLASRRARRARAACLFTAHGYLGRGAASSYRLGAVLLRRARIPVIAVCHNERALWTRLGLPPWQVTVVHNGVPDPQHDPGRPADLNRSRVRHELVTALQKSLPGDAFLVGLACRLVPEKGALEFVEALARLAGSHPRLYGVVMGDGPLRALLEERVRTLGLSERIWFAGAVPRASRYFGALDVLCQTSLEEIFSLSVIEGMAAGCAVVATSVGGMPEMIRDGVDGVLVPPGEPVALARALEALVTDPSLLARMRQAARRRYEEAFTVQRMARSTVDLYRTLAGATSASGVSAGDSARGPSSR